MSSPSDLDEWVIVEDPREVARKSRLAYERETRERLERLLRDPKIAREIRLEHQLLLDNAERDRRAYNYEVYIEEPDIESAMISWEDKKIAAEAEERVRQREIRKKWRRKAQRALEMKRRSKLRRPKQRRRVKPSLLRRSRRKFSSPMERWHKLHAKKSRIIHPGKSKIVLKTRRSLRKPKKRKRSPFVKINIGGRRTRRTRTRRTLRKRRKTRKHK